MCIDVYSENNDIIFTLTQSKMIISQLNGRQLYVKWLSLLSVNRTPHEIYYRTISARPYIIIAIRNACVVWVRKLKNTNRLKTKSIGRVLKIYFKRCQYKYITTVKYIVSGHSSALRCVYYFWRNLLYCIIILWRIPFD